MAYNTEGRKKIYQFLEANKDRTVSAAQIDQWLKEQELSVNITTIYRYLDKLVQDGKVIRYTAENGEKSVYQYVTDQHCEEHLHLTCVECGTILHLDCDFMDDFIHHVQRHHGFTLMCNKSMLYGLCAKCQSGHHSVPVR